MLTRIVVQSAILATAWLFVFISLVTALMLVMFVCFCICYALLSLCNSFRMSDLSQEGSVYMPDSLPLVFDLEVVASTCIRHKKPWPRLAFIGEVSYCQLLCFAFIMCCIISVICFSREFSFVFRLYSVSQKKSPLRGPDIFLFFHKRLRIFNRFFTHLLYVLIHARLQMFIQLSPILTKLCHIKRVYPVHIICSKCSSSAETHVSRHLCKSLIALLIVVCGKSL